MIWVLGLFGFLCYRVLKILGGFPRLSENKSTFVKSCAGNLEREKHKIFNLFWDVWPLLLDFQFPGHLTIHTAHTVFV